MIQDLAPNPSPSHLILSSIFSYETVLSRTVLLPIVFLLMSKPLGISLSGGGVRGLAHIGVLQALEEHGIYPHHLSGASAGALVAVLYAAGYSPPDILSIFKDSSLTRLFKVGLPTSGLSDNSYLIEVLRDYLDEDSFEHLPRRLHISITNLTTGQYEIRSEGELFRVIAASAAIPVLFQGKEIDEEIYVDGGVLNNLPIEPLVGRCYPLVGVNVTPIHRKEKLEGMLEISYRTFDLVMWGNVSPRLNQCDVILEPNAHLFSLFDLKSADQIYQLGYECALQKMPEIQKLIDVKGQEACQQQLAKQRSGKQTTPSSGGDETADEAGELVPDQGWLRRQTHQVGDFFRQIGQRFGN
jgi:NTE family protein